MHQVQCPCSHQVSAEVVAVASRSLEKAQAFIKETQLEGTAQALGSYDELINDKSIDALCAPRMQSSLAS